MNKQKHIIHRQILEISFSNRDKAFRMQDEISRLYKQELLPLINDMFDEAVSTNEHIRIDSLEIDVGRVSLQHFEDVLMENIKKKLKDKLLRSVQKASPKRYPQKDLPGTGRSAEATVRSKQLSELELFVFFVKTGQLPWWAAEDQNQPIEELALKIVRNQPEALAKLLIELTSDERYKSRIIYQFSDKVLREFLELNHPGIGEHVSNLINDFYAVHRQEQIIPLSSPNFRLFLWKSAFDFWLSGSTGIRQKMKQYDLSDLNPNIPNPDGITADSHQSYGLSVPDQINDFLMFVLKNLASKRQVERTLPDKQEVRQVIRSIFQSISDRGINTGILKNMLDSVQDELNKLVLDRDRDKPLPDFEEVRRTSSKFDAENSQEQRPEKKPLDFEESFEIHNAGLVIIAQFLPRFFDNLGLVSEKSFVTDDAAKRAALLLQYIITGETETPEHELILNKILCGLPVDEPLPKSIEISDIEKEEVETLLQSVVEHWEALKGTSVEGLRQTFLIKDGILKQEENGWKLMVERTTVDVLIDKLPWGISIIKLPWHDTMIHVEW